MEKILRALVILLFVTLTMLVVVTMFLIGCRQEENLVDNTVVLSSVPDETINIEEPPELGPPIVEEIETVDKVTYRVTAYCACEKCCGKWALNRPLDENGNPIVYGAAGEVLTSGVSVASPLPFGTQIELDGYGTVTVHDRTAKWVVEKYGENIIDIYFDSHEEAWNWGLQYLEGVIVE